VFDIYTIIFLALAVFISDAGSSGPAVDAAGRFLRAQK